MKAKDFESLLRKIEDKTFVGSKLVIEGVVFLASTEEYEKEKLTDEQAILLAKALKKNPAITEVDLSCNNIGNEGAAALAEVESLEILHLYENLIGNSGAKALAGSKLKMLNLADNPIGVSLGLKDLKKQVAELFEMAQEFVKNKTIIELRLGGYNEIPGDVMSLLIGENSTIKILEVGGLTDKALEFIKNNKTLEVLNVKYGNQLFCLSDKGVEYIIQNNSLKEISLSYSEITDLGAKMLSSHSTLKILSLGDSNITFEGAKFFLKSGLEEIDLYSMGGGKMTRKQIEDFRYLFTIQKTKSDLPEGYIHKEKVEAEAPKPTKKRKLEEKAQELSQEKEIISPMGDRSSLLETSLTGDNQEGEETILSKVIL